MRHLTTADFERVRSGDLSADDAEALGRHVAECDECAVAAGESLDLAGSAAAFDAAFTEEEADVLEMPRRAEARRSTPRLLWAGAAAAAVALVVFLIPRAQNDIPSPHPPPAVTRTIAPPVPPVLEKTRPPEWDALVARTRETGVLPFPSEIRELGLISAVRGESEQIARQGVWPTATAIDDVQPEFRWPATKNAHYTISVTANGDEIARSGPLTAAHWRVPVPLRRGEMVRWQVTVERGEESFVLPAPPAPPAIFRVLAADEHEALERARAEAGDDHLLLALLYARAGVVSEARAELDAYARASGDPLARRLLQQLPAVGTP